MKTQLKGIPFIMGMLIILFAGCKKEDASISAANQSAAMSMDIGIASNAEKLNKPTPVTITMAITGGSFPTFTGPITTTENLIPPGQGSMLVNSFGGVFHCTITLVTFEGTLTIRQECNKATFMGQWQIAEGTGAYANLRGNGKVMMPRGFEVLEGVIYWIR